MRELRKEKGLSQEGFADNCGLSRTYMGTIERGQAVISIETAEKIARGLSMNLADLFGTLDRS